MMLGFHSAAKLWFSFIRHSNNDISECIRTYEGFKMTKFMIFNPVCLSYLRLMSLKVDSLPTPL